MSDESTPETRTSAQATRATTGAGPRIKGGAKKAVRWTLWTVIVLAVLVAALPFLLSTAWARSIIQAWLDENVDRKVDFAALDVSWSEGIRIDGLVVHDEFEANPPLLTAPHVVIRTPLLSLLTRKITVEEFLIEDAVLTLSRGEDGELNTADVMKRKRVRRKPRGGASEPKPTEGEPVEETVLPEIHVPVEVRNLTLVFRRADGYEARQSGVSFRGDITTRDGPTKFDIRVPSGTDGSIKARGNIAILADDGLLLPREEWKITAAVDIKGIDAAQNGEILKLFLGETPASGIVDAKLGILTTGQDARGSVSVTIRGLAYGDAVERRKGNTAEDLTFNAKFESTAGVFKLEGLKVRAEGLVVDGELSGEWPKQLTGKVAFDADLGRMGSTLGTIGVDLGGRKVEGHAKGEITFTPSPSVGQGTIALTGFRASGFAEGAAPVSLNRAEVSFRVKPSAEEVRIESFDVKVDELTAQLAGVRMADGTVDMRATANGDLGKLLARVRDLGLLPQEFSLNGTLDAAVQLKGRAASDGGAGFTTTIEKLVLAEEDMRVSVSGTVEADGGVNLAASGEGDLGRLLGRAQKAGATGSAGSDTLRGRFAFDAAAKGPANAIVVMLPRLHLDGDLVIDASGAYQPSGALAASIRARGRVQEALALAGRLGFDLNLPAGYTIDGTIDADAEVRGTTAAPEVPKFSLTLDTPPLTLTASGSLSADRALAATASGSGDLAKLADLAVRLGFVETLPPATGRLAFEISAAGTSTALALPKVHVTVREGPADLEVTGAMESDGRVSGTVLVDGALADLCRFARSGGWLDKDLAPAGRIRISALAAGTRDAFQVTQADLTLTGPLALEAKGSFASPDQLRATGSFRGGLQGLLDVAAQWTGSKSTQMDGSLDGSFGLTGTLTKPVVTLPKFALKAGTLDLAGRASRDPTGDVAADMTLRGGADELVRVLSAFGIATDVKVTGALDITADATMKGTAVTAQVVANVANLVLDEPKVAGESFRESRVALTVPRIAYDTGTGRLEPIDLTLRAEGLDLAARVEATEGPPEKDGSPQRIVTAEGKATVDKAFATNHAALFGGDMTFQRAELPFRFTGDIAHGRNNAAQWTGGFTGNVTAFTAPNLVVDELSVVGMIVEGQLRLDPVKGVVNGGPVTAKIALGLVGDAPTHRIELSGQNMKIDGSLATFVSKVSPLFAGENGRMGGKVSVTMDLTAAGLDREKIENTLNGKGEMMLDGAYVESSDLIGSVLQLLGGSGRMEFANTKVPFEVKNGRVHTGELAMDAVGLAMRIGGDVQLQTQKVDYGFRIKPTGTNAGFGKYGTFLDSEGFLPLRIKGTLSKPKLRAPDLKDALKGQLDGLLDGFLGGKKDDPAPPEPEKGKGGKRKKKDVGGTGSDGSEDVPPPPPPPGGNDDPPPPPPPGGGNDDSPPPPPPPGK